MKLYVEAKSKADLIRRLAAGEEISGFNYSIFGGGGHYMLDDNLEDGTIIAVYTKKVQGNPVAKAWGTWTNKVLKAESFGAEEYCRGCGGTTLPIVDSESGYCEICHERWSDEIHSAETFEAEFLSCYECGTDIEEDDDDLRNCDLCGVFTLWWL